MGWFNDQIEYRRKRENELLHESFQNIAKTISGRKVGVGLYDEDNGEKDAVSQLLKYFDVREKEVPSRIKDLEDKIDYLLSSTGILYREVKLEKGWHRDAMGAMLGSLKESGSVVTILPGSSGGFIYVDPETGTRKKINSKEAEKFNEEAYIFYRSLPMRKLELLDLWKFMWFSLTTWDMVSYCLAALTITLVGMLIPKMNKILTGQVVDYKSGSLLAAVMTFMVCITIGNLIFSTIKQMLLNRISTKLSVSMSAATMMRVLALPAHFFKNYTTGELTQYLGYMNTISNKMVNVFLTTGITGVFSLVYLFQIFNYASSLVLPSLFITISTLLLSFLVASIQTVISREQMRLTAKENGMVFSLISGIQKIRLSGAEKRAFVKWADLYAAEAETRFTVAPLVKLSNLFSNIISLFGTIVIYFVAVKSHVSVSDYYAFNAAYAYIAAAFASLTTIANTVATIKPTLELIKPLMDAEPEIAENLETVTSLSGSIELSHVSFKYTENGPLIVDDLSLTIPARQYVAIVGTTGCGKSTLLKLILGFEKPMTGTIFFDKKDSRRLDMGSVRKKIGTVMQDGKLFQGSIYENIAISAPNLTMDQAWEAAEMAGIADDIRHMPMGMHTMISGGAGGISGGQRQRLMIARAVAPKPKIIFLDEATSALDNITQKHVSDAMDHLKCTRIVIAHRLSTIRHCDRILVMDHGKIIEDGTYEQLLEKKGFFAELVERQRV